MAKIFWEHEDKEKSESLEKVFPGGNDGDGDVFLFNFLFLI